MYLIALLQTSFLLLSSAAVAQTPAQLLERFRAATGGDAWSEVATISATGRISAGGLRGALQVDEDLIGGMRVSHYDLGTFSGAEGDDGRAAWNQDPGGEVSVADTPDALRRARSERWLSQRGYWFGNRGAVRYSDVEIRVDGGRQFAVFSATPSDGSPVQLWFDGHCISLKSDATG